MVAGAVLAGGRYSRGMNPRVLLLVPLLLPLAGCIERRIEITSEPSGALVWVNDQQVGRTPTQAAFKYHGVYDVRLQLDGFEPLVTEAEASPPIYEHAPLDLFAEMAPAQIENVQRWHFVLEPALETRQSREELEAGLLERAGEMRRELEAIPAPDDGEDADEAFEPAEGDKGEGAESGQAGSAAD